ncbi:MAG: hypothetical protein ABI724_12640 [Betaproteobacteria bacterium]
MIITASDFEARVTANPDLALNLINQLIRRMRALTGNFRSLPAGWTTAALDAA